MLTRYQLEMFLNHLFPGLAISDPSVNGLQVEGKEHVKTVATAVTASLETIEAAANRNVDALIVHHGLFWQKDAYSIVGSKKKKIALLLEKEISLFAYHLPLDLHKEIGNNWKAAMDLGLYDLSPFGVIDKVGIGVKGKIKSISKENLMQQLESYYEHSAVCAWGGPDQIETIAIVSGGAYKMINEAATEKIDAFITGSFDEPVWHLAKEESINFYALGHSATERIGPKALAKHLQENLNLSCSFIDIPNPF